MAKTIIAEGKTTKEAIDNGLNNLKVSKNMVDIKVLEENKKSFFSILAPRTVKVELTVKENIDIEEKNDSVKKVRVYEVTQEDIDNALKNAERFIDEFIYTLNKKIEKEIEVIDNIININFKGEDAHILIGSRGDTLKAFQTLLFAIANKDVKNRVKFIVDVDGYKDKRKATLERLAVKISKTVSKTGKPIKLEPMPSYERKIIHSKLQKSNDVKTYSVGEEPYRRIVIEKI